MTIPETVRSQFHEHLEKVFDDLLVQKVFFNDKFLDALREVILHVLSLLEGNPLFTAYGFNSREHCLAVQQQIIAFVGSAKFSDESITNDLHKFLLLAAAWLHVIETGTFTDPKRDSSMSAIINTFYKNLKADIKKSLSSPEDYVTNIQKIIDCALNRKFDAYWADRDSFRLIGKEIQISLLACYFLLGYKFHVNHIDLNDESFLYEIFVKKNDESSMRLKIQLLKAIFLNGAPSLNRHDKNVEVNVSWPDDWNDADLIGLREDILKRLIVDDLKETLDEVKDFLIRNSFYDKGSGAIAPYSHMENIFVGVRPIDNSLEYVSGRREFEIGGYPIKEQVLKQILENAALLLYPNASKLINITIRNLERIALLKENPIEKKIKYTKIRDLLAELIKNRPCHAGLMLIHDLLDRHLAVIKDDQKPQELKDYIKTLEGKIFSFKKIKEQSLPQISKYSLPLILDGGNILLYGNSDTITKVFSDFIKFAKDSETFDAYLDKMDIFISECRNKTILKYDNSFWYCDALEYARKIYQSGWHKKIKIISESVLANVLSEKGLINKIFLGANGIDIIDGYCAHTAGHLLVAELAKKNDIPLYVFADTLKFYALDSKNSPNSSAPPRHTRDTYWFCSKRQFHKMSFPANFKKNNGESIPYSLLLDMLSYNRQEDVVDKSLVTLFVTDVGIVPPQNLSSILKTILSILGSIINPPHVSPLKKTADKPEA